jgi:hypothetical protein
MFYYILVEEGDPSNNYAAAGAIRDVVLYRASTSDGSTVNQITLNESKGKLYEDDNTYGAKYKPVGSIKMIFSAKLDKVAVLATREQISPSLTPGRVYQTSIYSMFDGDLAE